MKITIAIVIAVIMWCMFSGCSDSNINNKPTPGPLYIDYTFITSDGTELWMKVNRSQPISVYTHNGVTYTLKLDGTFYAVTNK